MEIPKETKTNIIKTQIRVLENTLYQLSIQIRVAEKINDEEMKKNIVGQMVKHEKMKDEYELILNELTQDNNPDSK